MDDLRAKIANAISGWYAGGDEPTWGDYQIAEVVMQVLREQEPVAWVHSSILEKPTLGMMCSPMQLGSGQVPLFKAPMPPSVPKLPNCGRYYAVDNTGQWHYITHAGEWQPCPPVLSVPEGYQIIDTALLQRASWAIGRFIDGGDWTQEDMDVMDDLDAHLCRSAPKPEDSKA